MKRVLAIVVTYNAENWLAVCLESLLNSKYPVDIALVDNASKDFTVSNINENYVEKVKYFFPLQENLGFGKAHNFVLSQDFVKDYDYILLLNQDAAISREGVKELIDIAELKESYGIVSPIHYFKENIMDRMFALYYSRKKVRVDSYSKGNVRVCSFINAAIWLVKKRVFEQIGGFDPLFGHYGEDSNFVQRCRKVGFEIAVGEDIVGFHYRPQESTGLNNKPPGDQLYIAGLTRLLNPFKTFGHGLAWVLAKFSGQIIGSLMNRKFNDAAGVAKNFFKLCTLFPQILKSRRETRNRKLIYSGVLQ